jgi:dTDP-4-amino-4,6-dideoxygalactose transaminase
MILALSPKIRENSIENVIAVLKSGWIGLGQKTEAFEKRFAIVGANCLVIPEVTIGEVATVGACICL